MTVAKIVSGRQVLIDDEDEAFFDLHKYWYLRNTGLHLYLQTSYRKHVGDQGPRKYFIFHRHVMKCVPKDGKVVDHINGDTLDNRKANLRVADHSCNMRNSVGYGSTSRYKGVHFYKGRFAAKIYNLAKKQEYLGRYESEIEAAYAYDLASVEYYGDQGRRNFLPLVHANS